MTGNIYIIKNTKNNKVYIGKTFNNIKCRFKEHLRASRKVKCEHRKLYRAIRKYGEDAFYIELLEDNIEESELNAKEIFYINEFDSYKNGYNSTIGGDGSKYLNLNDEEVIKFYNKSRSIRHTAKAFNVSSDTISLLLHNNNVTIFKPNAKRVRIVDLNLEFESIKDCEKYLIENKYANSSHDGAVSLSIKRSIQRNGKYLKMKFEILD